MTSTLKILPVLALLSVTACTQFSLGFVQPQPGKSTAQMQFDVAVCKNEAFNAAGTPDKQAGAFLLGLTLVGAPVAYELDKATQRSVFRSCMLGLGYVVTPASELAR